jgi:uncharacterized protein (DUF1501 family)
MWSRRTFLRSSAFAGALLVSPSLRALAEAQPRRRPTRLVLMRIAGGLDSILATDPKERAEVDGEIDLPYEPSAIHEVDGVRLGPLARWLAPYLKRTAILNGVVCSTVAHATGTRQVRQMRRIYPRGSPGLGALLGGALGTDTPFTDATNEPDDNTSPPRQLVVNSAILEKLTRLAGNEPPREALRRAIAAEHARCATECRPLEAVTRLLDRLPPVPLEPAPKLVLTPHYPGLVDQPLKYALDWTNDYASLFRDVLHILEHGLAPVVSIATPGDWDTHQFNQRFQHLNMAVFAPAMCYFLAELERRTTRDGIALAEQTALVLCSELGRFPCVNEFKGKDHFPEMPVILMGPGLLAGQYGQTDRKMMSVPISLATGHTAASGRAHVPTLDDVGATILRWFGVADPAALGFLGRPLDFLLA